MKETQQPAAHNPISDYLGRQAVIILDGGLATELEQRGADLRHKLWSAKMLREDPGMIREVHLDFLRAGADVITTATYQASFAGFAQSGCDSAQASRLMRLSVELACQAREAFAAAAGSQARLRPLVAASIGPYGACLPDGGEYHGNYDLGKSELIDFHRPRMEVLAETEADLFAFETIPNLLEAEALIELLEDFPDKTAWLSFSCRDGTSVSHGEAFAHCAKLADDAWQIAAVGVNCTNPDYVESLLKSAAGVSTPLVAYPNSGERWEPHRYEWSGEGSGIGDVTSWARAGARLIGGCCRIGPPAITAMRSELLTAQG